MWSKKDIELLEEKILAPYGMKSRDTAGREYEEPLQDIRTCYQRDRDRIIHSAAFRRLEYKTQVFVIFEGDYYRTRLTHTIEVAQIARTIGRNLRLNEDLIEAIALAHDLGHPPFGHAGELALKEIMEKSNLGFDHNFRSFEIVTKFEKRYPGFDGLNLTEEVLIGILKHEARYDKKQSVRKYNNKCPTLEAKVVDIADSIAYLSHDIDDGLTSEYIKKEDLMESEFWREANREIDSSLKNKDTEIFKYQVVKFLINIQVKDLLEFSCERLEQLNFSSTEKAREYMNSKPKEEIIGFSHQMCVKRDFLQKLLDTKLYHHYRVVRMTDQAMRIIKNLFDVYKNNPEQLPYDVYPRDRGIREKEKYEIICNYIASMTDRLALNEYKRLFDPYHKI